MIQVFTVAARRLPIPIGSDKYFIATLSVGDVTVSTSPAKPVMDARLGASITFRDTLELPCPTDVGGSYDPHAVAVHIQIRSVCGSINLGAGICRVNKDWVPMVPSGEVLCGFSVHPVLHPPPFGVPAKKRPVTAGPTTQRPGANSTSNTSLGVNGSSLIESAQDESSAPAGEYAGELSIRFDRIIGLGLPTTLPVSLYAQVQFALEDKQSEICEAVPEGEGHAGRWRKPGTDVTFEVLPSNLTRVVSIMLYAAEISDKQKHNMIGMTKLEVQTNLGGENHREQKTLTVSGHPRSKLFVEYSLVYAKPRKEGASGRPLSAYPRRTSTSASQIAQTAATGPLPSSSSATARVQPPLAMSEDQLNRQPEAAQNAAATPNSATKLRSKIGAGRKAWGSGESPDPDRSANSRSSNNNTSSTAEQQQDALGRLIAEKLEERIAARVESAVAKVLERLSSLELRVQRTEEMIGQLRPPSGHQGANRKIPRAPSSQGAASRPSSADSVTGNYDVSQSIVSEQQLRAKFAEYDTSYSGSMSLAQLIQFYRSSSMFGDEEDEGRVLKFFEAAGIKVQSTTGVTFDEFAKVALKLAAR